MNITELRKADGKRGWTSIPETCPARFVNAICEKRQRAITTNSKIAVPDFRGFTGTRQSYYCEVSPTTAGFLSSLSWHRDLQKALRTQADIAAKQEAREVEAARVAAEQARAVAELHAELFPWERA